MSKPKGLLDVIFTNPMQPLRWTHPFCSLIRYRFVHNIPAIDRILVTFYNRLNMGSHSGKQQFAAGHSSVTVLEHPAWRLIMPYKRMASQIHTVLAREAGNLVSLLKGIAVLLRMKSFELHFVLGGQAVIMLLQKIALADNRPFIYCCSNKEIVPEGFS